MFFAPNSKAVTTGVSYFQQHLTSRVVADSLSRAFLTLALVAVLTGCLGSAYAQGAAPQFEELAGRAAAARDQQNIPQAIELYKQAAEIKPDWAEGWWNLGLLQYSSDQFQPAIQAFNRLIQLEPNAVPAIALRGLCEFETGAYDDSLRDLEQGVAKGAASEPRNAQIIRYHLGLLLTRAGRFEDAMAQYGFFVSQHIDNPDLMLALGMAGMRVRALPGDVAAADREMYQAAGRAGYVVLSGDALAGDDLFRQLFARFPAAPNLHFFYGVMLFPQARDLAVDQLQAEVTVAPTNVAARTMLAYTLMISGRYSEALPEAERAYAAEPSVEVAQITLGRSLAEAGETQRGIELLNKVVQRDPNNMDAHLGLVAAYSRTGRREDAYRERLVCLSLAK
jgi:tetratricopeptide (TPR) repeat protein